MGYADKLRLLIEWAPAINFLIAVTSAPPGRDRVYRALELLDYLASRTPTQVDNEFLGLLRGVLLTPQGGLLLDYLAARVQPMFQEMPRTDNR